MTPHPVIDVTSRPQTPDELVAPLADRRLMARRVGELWAAIMLTQLTPFVGTKTVGVTVLILCSIDDDRVNEFVELTKTQAVSKAVKVIELIGGELDVARNAYHMALTSDANVGEVTVRLIERFLGLVQNESALTDSVPNEDGA